MRAGARAAAVALMVAVTLVLTGCVSWFLPPETSATSEPTGERVAAELEPFYHQVLTWESCGPSLQCSTASAPLDWADPSHDSIELALVRHVATGGNRIGSLLVNPGGPGGSGVAFVQDSLDYAAGKRLQASFDIVGFDPRGVGASTRIVCHETPSELDAFLYDIPPGVRGSDEWIAGVTAVSAGFAQSCSEHTGELLQFVDTLSAARDLDLLRAVLGDDKLNYLGYSYGSLLGATYADLFPERTGRMVLDGAVDPTATNADLNLAQARGFEQALRSFIGSCLGSSDCPFSGSVDDAMAQVRLLLDTLEASPLTASDGRRLGSNTMFTAIILPLYNAGNWVFLSQLFAGVKAGEADFAFSLADSYNSRNPDGSYADNQTEAFLSINCLDYPVNDDPVAMRAAADELAAAAPVMGPQLAYSDILCGQWPFPPVREPGPLRAAGSADILVVGTTGDPATPYAWAQALAGQLENGHLVSYDGEGHTAYNKSNQCVDDAVENFLVDGVVPAADPRC